MKRAKKNHVPDGRAKNGGLRKGQGRPPGAATRLARYKPKELVDAHESPLDVMVDNMLFWYRASKTIEQTIAGLVSQGIDDAERQVEFLSLLKKFLSAREQSQKCAVDAAPYVHPRLAAIQFKGEMKTEVTAILGTMTAQQAAEAYADTLRMGKP